MIRCIVLCSALAFCSVFSVASTRPHVLFIAVDDLRPELASDGTAGQPIQARTPRIDRLA